MPTFATPPSADDIVDLADRALAAIPAALRAHVRGVAITVEDFADAETLDEMGIESEWDLSGLYRGTPLHLRGVSGIARAPDMIFLYRQPILLEWIETGEDLFRLVRNVLIHEIAHHFGFSDDGIAALERDMELAAPAVNRAAGNRIETASGTPSCRILLAPSVSTTAPSSPIRPARVPARVTGPD